MHVTIWEMLCSYALWILLTADTVVLELYW